MVVPSGLKLIYMLTSLKDSECCVRVKGRTHCNSGNLASISPFGQEGQDEGLRNSNKMALDSAGFMLAELLIERHS